MSAADLRWIQEIAAEIRLKLNHVEECEAQLKSLADEHPVIGPYTEAVGHVTLCVLLMAVGDPRDYTSSGAYLKAFGLNLKEVSSGNHQGRLSISKRGPSIARKWLYHWAMRAVQKPELRNWYDEFKKVGGKHHRNSEHRPMKGLVAVMRKLSRSLWHAVKHEEPFDYAKVFPGKPLAAIPHLVGTVEA
jgi:transposase